jgi:hypothetical protein
MFPFQRMAAPMMPHQAAMTYRCFITYEICCDTGFSCAVSLVTCAGHSEASMLCPNVQVAAGDPVEQLAAFRTQLEVTLAGVTAQEKLLKERQGPKP